MPTCRQACIRHGEHIEYPKLEMKFLAVTLAGFRDSKDYAESMIDLAWPFRRAIACSHRLGVGLTRGVGLTTKMSGILWTA
jgi:hypothetical protein